MQRIINRLIPFILIGVALVAFAFGIFLLAYLFLLGACVGLILFIANWIKEKFFPAKMPMKSPSKNAGRTFDSDDWSKL